MKRILCLLLCLILAAGCTAALADQRVFRKGEVADFAPSEPLLEMYVCPLIGADAMILVCDGQVMAVDVGKLNHDVEVMTVLDSLGVTHMDMVFNSHPHDDHCAAMLNLVKDDVTIGKYITAFPDNHSGSNSVQGLVLRAVTGAGIPVEHVSDGDVFYLGSAKFTCMQRMFGDGNINNSSCVLLVEYGDSKMLLTGDIDNSGESMLMKDHPWLGKVDIMKAPHHGLAKLKGEMMNVVDPEFVFITNGSGSSGPCREWLDRHKIPYIYSSRGPIYIATNGDYWIVQQDLYEQFRNLK